MDTLNNTVPADYICPISMNIMSNPQIHSCGRSFDLESIQLSFSYGNNNCPLCRQQIIIGQNLFPNLQLKSLINDFNGIKINDVDINYSHDIPQLDIECFNTQEQAIIKFDTKQQPQRRKLNLCFVVDKSGSMNTVITLKQEGQEVSNGLTRFDLVKHTLKTVVSMLGKEDIISLITFNTNATIVFENVEMTQNNKDYVLTEIDKIQPSDSTNIWDGLRLGLELMYKFRNIMSNSSILLLTDGCPNIDPPMGYSNALNSVRTKHKVFTQNSFVCNIHTFGYGNDLDSKLLRDIADIGQGEFNFIPDASFVGTIFINALTNIMLTHTISTQVTLNYTDNSYETIECNSILYQQDRTIVIPTNKKEVSSITINYQDYYSKKNKNVTTKSKIIDFNKIYNDYVRTQLVNMIVECLETRNFYRLKDFIQNLKSSQSNEYIKDLIKDAEGEILMAFSHEYFNKWGKHYLRSISKAHECQLRNNFKDPGIQHYCAAKIYDDIRLQLNDIFNTLPAPKPSGTVYNQNIYQHITMTQLNNPQGGCISGDSLVVILKNMTDIVTVRLENVKVNDFIAVNTSPYKFARVTHIIVTTTTPEKPFLMICLMGGLKITPWHPVFIQDKWVFPADLVMKGQGVAINYYGDVYNIVLENPSENTQIISAKYPCITLGHNILNDPVASHEYLGTNKIIDDINKLPRNVDGKIYINPEDFIRDSTTGLINSIKY